MTFPQKERLPCSMLVKARDGCECRDCRRNRRIKARRESARINKHWEKEREAQNRPPVFWRHCDRLQPVGPCVTCGSQPGWVKTAS